MPRKVPNYSQSSIYKLCCNNPDIIDIYVGSTTGFSKRKWAHKSCCNNATSKHYNYNVYQFIRANGGWDNWSMVQIEQYNATDKRNLETRERHYIEQLGATLNKNIPTRTDKEYRQDNAEHIKEHMKQYYIDNQENIKQQKKQYYQANAEHIKQQSRKNFDCPCSGKYQHGTRARHFKSKKHCSYEYQKLYDFIYR